MQAAQVTIMLTCLFSGCPLGSYSFNCSKQCHCRVGQCDGVTGACGNGVCKDGWKGIACHESKLSKTISKTKPQT